MTRKQEKFNLYLNNLFLYIFEFFSEVLNIRFVALHFHGSPLLQCLVAVSCELKALAHLVTSFLVIYNATEFKKHCVTASEKCVTPFFNISGTWNISLVTSPSSLTLASSDSKVIHCSLYISARRWDCFSLSCSTWWKQTSRYKIKWLRIEEKFVLQYFSSLF